MAGISHNAKNSNLPEFGDSVSGGSKALCGLTEAAAQVRIKFLLISPWSKTIQRQMEWAVAFVILLDLKCKTDQ